MRAPRKGPQRPLTPEEQAEAIRRAAARKRGQGKHKATAREGIEQMTTRIKKIRRMLDTHNGRCLDCGDEWQEYEPVTVCPECGSINVADGGNGLSPSSIRTSESIISILEAQIAKEEAARAAEVVE